MATWKNTSGGNLDTYDAESPTGSLSYRVGHIRAGETFDAIDAILYLKITSGLQVGNYIKRAGLTLQSSTPPPDPEPDPEPTITLKHVIKVYSDGSLIIDGQPYP